MSIAVPASNRIELLLGSNEVDRVLASLKNDLSKVEFYLTFDSEALRTFLNSKEEHYIHNNRERLERESFYLRSLIQKIQAQFLAH